MEALAPIAYGFALIFFRTAGLVVAAPLFGMANTPSELKVALAAGLAFVTCAGAGFPHAALPPHLGVLLGDVVLETVVGLLAGTAARFALEGAAAAGQLVAQAMGLGYGAMLDPMNGAESTALGELMRVLAISAAISIGLHRELVLWLANSVVEVPPGAVTDVAMLAKAAVVQAIDTVALGVRLGFPFLAAVTLGHLVLGVLGRAAQQLHISNVGFSVSILFGGGALWVAAPPMLHRCAQVAVAMLSRG